MVLAIDVIKTEFPDCEFLQSFAMFKLPRDVAPAETHHQCITRHAQRLASKANFDPAALEGQTIDVRPLAQHLRVTMPGYSTLDAWREALQRKRRGRHVEYNALERGLCMFAVFHLCTTSNTERTLGVQTDHLTLLVVAPLSLESVMLTETAWRSGGTSGCLQDTFWRPLLPSTRATSLLLHFAAPRHA